jgi:succinate dehydrogenase / fumarate reductase cytochrome b subunit
MSFVSQLWRSSLGKKYLMGLSGFVLVFFIFTHMMGNFQIFFGPYWLNTYGQFLHDRHELIWPARIVLVTMVLLHAWSAFRLRAENRAARTVGYAHNPVPFATTYASRTILMSGLIVGAFVVYHLLHFTLEVPAANFLKDPLGIQAESLKPVDFGQPVVSAFYLLALGLLCLHLSHGMRAMFQSVGWNWTFGGVSNLPNLIAKWGAVLIFLIYSSIPVAVLCGYGRDYARQSIERYVATH